MDDVISRQAAIDWLKNEWDGMVTSVFKGIENLPSAQPEPITFYIDHELTQEEYEKLREDVANAPIMLLPAAQPTADVVEVVRCKACKHRKKNTFCLHNMRYEDDNGFCSYGDRTEE